MMDPFTSTSANISFIFATPSHVSIYLVVLNTSTSSPFHEQKYKSNLNGHFSKEVQIEIKSKRMKTLFFGER